MAALDNLQYGLRNQKWYPCGILERIKKGEWDDTWRCLRCHDRGEAVPGTVFFHYNCERWDRGHDWFYCDACYEKEKSGISYGSDPKVLYRRSPIQLQLKVIVKG